MKKVAVDAFLDLPGVILDVRSPAEFAQGRIPEAHNLPLFSNEERAQVGTCYKQEGQQPAVQLGMNLVSEKLTALVDLAAGLIGDAPTAKIHCWRGGMRSEAVGHLISTIGAETIILEGGYKAFRGHCLDILNKIPPLRVVGGMTGSGKTRILQRLKELGEQVLDLEALANHRGSAFGALGKEEQPSNEQFENAVAMTLRTFDLERTVWVEDESRLIGKCKLPDSLYHAIQSSPLFVVERPKEERVAIIKEEYGQFTSHKEAITAIVHRIKKRHGGAQTKQALDLLEAGHYDALGMMLLEYYDRTYHHALDRKPVRHSTLEFTNLDDAAWAERLIQEAGRG